MSALSVDGPERRPRRLHARHLSRREHEHAGILGVVHEVENRIESWFGGAAAAVPADRTEERRAELRGRVRHEVALGAALVLERVIQREPVPDLVRRRIPLTVNLEGPTRQRTPIQDDPVEYGELR